ncbi:phospholipid-binding protein MlaC [Bermanella sp. R86510]|uniref:MlaC/ttg2D family ABC transporter substrate-binding protein n=1 Tax=unclassified Bermanella TaxID=2627862 RepID=UPI0037C8D4BA
MKAILAGLALLLSFSLPVVANDDAPQKIVKEVADVVLREILENKEKLEQGPEFLLMLVEEQMMPIIDDRLMSRLALGDNWEKIDAEQQDQFIEGFKRLLVKTYAGAFKAYTGQDVTYGDTRYNSSKSKAIVNSQIEMSSGSPVRLQYRLYKNKDGEWLVYDANIAGLSLIKTYRIQFAEQIEKEGVEQTISKLNSVQL